MSRLSTSLLVLVASLAACRDLPTGNRSSTFAETGSASGLFTCDVAQPSRSQCHLTTDGAVVVPQAGIHADVEIAYAFGCPSANKSTTMSLYVEDGAAQELKLQTAATLQFSTEQAVRIRDDNETYTRSRKFNPAADCSLNLTYRLTPSAVQVSRWAETSADVVALIDANVELYDLKKEVQYWYEKYVSSPDLIGGILRERAATLLQSEKLKDRQLGTSLNAIADNAPHALIMEPYATYRERLLTYRDRGRALVDVMERWQQAVLDALRASLDEANGSLAQ